MFLLSTLTYLRYDLAGARNTHQAPEPVWNSIMRE
eukprot:COSAG01_NODE_49620_length_370_cov_4.295203_1_plen_34_part_10